jgi:hypothetical protein
MIDNVRADQMFDQMLSRQAIQDTDWTLLWKITRITEEPLMVTVTRNQEWSQGWTHQGNRCKSTGTARCLLCLKDIHRTSLTQPLIRYSLSPLHTMIKQLPSQGLWDPTVRLPQQRAEAANRAIQEVILPPPQEVILPPLQEVILPPPQQVIPFPPQLLLPVLPGMQILPVVELRWVTLRE